MTLFRSVPSALAAVSGYTASQVRDELRATDPPSGARHVRDRLGGIDLPVCASLGTRLVCATAGVPVAIATVDRFGVIATS